MKTTNILGDAVYESPYCILLDISSEGILCASFDGIDKEFDYNIQ